MREKLKEFIKKIVFRHTSLGKPNYSYCIEPIQLNTLINEIERLRDFDGNIAEIGVARGMTTRFLAQHIVSQNMENSLTYFAIDTFDSFVAEDLEYEIKNRGKTLGELEGFRYNDFNIWKSNFLKFPFIKAIQSDCTLVDYVALSPLKLTLLDVDLYLPTIKTLPLIYDATISGGVIAVDDVLDGASVDGAYQAYMEFCSNMNLSPNIVGNKCGLIYKP